MARLRYRHTRHKTTSLVLTLIVSAVSIWTTTHQQAVKQAFVQNEPGTYSVTEFVDGDTIKVDMNGTTETLRFIGVDTPETHDPRKPVQCFGQAAANFTKSFIGQNPVRLEADPTNSNRDKYGRLLRYIYLPDGRLVNAELIKQGYGFAYVAFPFQKMQEFKAYEQQAKDAKRGLWGSCKLETNQYGTTQAAPADQQ